MFSKNTHTHTFSPQLEAYYAGEDPVSIAGDFGSHSLYKNLGYFSLIGLLRLHTQLGDYHQALQSVANVQLSKKVLATTRVPASQISLYYYVGFCYLMMRRYRVSDIDTKRRIQKSDCCQEFSTQFFV